MKKTAIKSIYLVIVFIVSFFIISAVVNQGNSDMTADMGPPTYPVVYVNVGGRVINEMHGYCDSMKSGFQRDSLTPLGQGRKVELLVETYDQTIEKMFFEVRSMDGERLVENTEIKNFEVRDNTIGAKFAVKDLIDEDTEYMLVLLLENDRGQTIRYYTRIIQTENYYTNEKIDYALDFHNKTFNKEQAKDLAKYLESNSEGDNTTYSKVTIHSSFNQITWGELNVSKVTEPELTIKEMASQTGSLELNYIVSIQEENYLNLYNVKEFFRVRYTSDRIYLLDYERTMKQIFDESAGVVANNKVMLGITEKEDIELVESDGGNVLAYTDGSRLYCYNVTDNKLSRLFSFYNGNYEDKRETWKKHGVKILNVDEAGNVQFIVYGYMNRGMHEGEVGIAVYHFSGLLNTTEEMVFIESDETYEILKAEIEELSYINKSNAFFFMHKDSIYSISLENRKCEIMISDLSEGSFKVSENNRMIVWQTGDNLYASSKLILMNLNTKKRTEINAGTGEYIAPLGFMGEDLVYGLAKREDIVQDKTGSTLFPMYCVKIENESGEVKKTNEEAGIYVTGGSIHENQINLTQVTKDAETGQYIDIESMQITNTEVENAGNNKIETAATDKYETIIQIAVKSKIDKKTLKNLTPKEVLFEGNRRIALKESKTEYSQFYVYGKGGLEGIFTDEGNAVNLAYDLSGTVVNENGIYIWIRGNRSLKNQIMAIKGAGINEEKNSMAVCLDTILKYEGIMRNTEYMLNSGDTIKNILKENLDDTQILDLTGCSLDAVLYYVDKDIPVLATMNDGSAVLIIGFNEMNTVLMDPLTGLVEKKGMNDSKLMFEENGNCFITYIREK